MEWKRNSEFERGWDVTDTVEWERARRVERGKELMGEENDNRTGRWGWERDDGTREGQGHIRGTNNMGDEKQDGRGMMSVRGISGTGDGHWDGINTMWEMDYETSVEKWDVSLMMDVEVALEYFGDDEIGERTVAIMRRERNDGMKGVMIFESDVRGCE
jgi:hypothetical protein